MKPFYDDAAAMPLMTPSGKVEIVSDALATHFPDDDIRRPFPKWIEESDERKERITSDRAKDYPYLLVSNHPHWRVHAQHDDIPWLREIETCKVIGPDGYAYEPIWVNPVDAKKLGLESGDIAKLFNERGGVLGGVRVSERIMPGVLYQDHGARVDTIVAGMGGLDRGGASNLICPAAVTSPNCPGEVTSGHLVGIEKVDVFELAAQYPEAFARTCDSANGQVAADYIIGEGVGSWLKHSYSITTCATVGTVARSPARTSIADMYGSLMLKLNLKSASSGAALPGRSAVGFPWCA